MKDINYKVMLFANIKDSVGTDFWLYNTQQPLTGGKLIDAFFDNYPGLERLRKLTRVAVDREFIDLNSIIKPSCEIAFIPPVSGG